MAECIICLESPCSCSSKEGSSKDKARAYRRSSVSRKDKCASTVAVEHVRSMPEVVRILAPLLAEVELEPYSEYLPSDCRLTLDERRARFRHRVQWSEANYNG